MKTINKSPVARLLALSWQYDVLSTQLSEKEQEYNKLSEAFKTCEQQIEELKKELEEDINNDKSV